MLTSVCVCVCVCVKADERQRAEADDVEDRDEVKVKDVNMLEAQNVSGAELMQIRVENIKNNQEKGHCNSLIQVTHSTMRRTL